MNDRDERARRSAQRHAAQADYYRQRCLDLAAVLLRHDYDIGLLLDEDDTAEAHRRARDYARQMAQNGSQRVR